MDIDLGNPDCYAKGIPVAWFEYIRKTDPLHWHESRYAKKGFWVVTTYRDLEFVAKHTELFSSAKKTVLLADPEGEELKRQRLFLINMDPPRHLKYRRVVNKAFTPQVINSLRGRLHNIAYEIIDVITKKDHCDFISEVSSQMPIRVICDLLGIDEAEKEFIAHNANIMVFSDELEFLSDEFDCKTAAAGLFAYGMKLYFRHKSSPGSTIIGMLIDGTVDDECLNMEEFCFFFLMLLSAGFETTKSVISSAMKLFIEHPEQFLQLQKNQQLLPNAIEEIIRYEPPTFQFFRTATADVELRDKIIKKGDKVAMFYHSANRDSELNSDPDRFDISRFTINHRSFGYGEHYCLGVHLAKSELAAILYQIINRIEAPKFCGDIIRMRSRFVNSYKSMPIMYKSVHAGNEKIHVGQY